MAQKIRQRGFGSCLLLLLSISLATPLASQQNSEHTLRKEKGSASPPATLKDASWLVGYWQGEGLGGQVEEVWSQPMGSTMMGMFRLIRDGETVFSEFMQFAELDGSLALRVKHFNLDFTGWETKEKFISFPLVKAEPYRLFLNGLTIERQSEDELVIYIVLRSGEEVSEEKLTLRRVKF